MWIAWLFPVPQVPGYHDTSTKMHTELGFTQVSTYTRHLVVIYTHLVISKLSTKYMMVYDITTSAITQNKKAFGLMHTFLYKRLSPRYGVHNYFAAGDVCLQRVLRASPRSAKGYGREPSPGATQGTRIKRGKPIPVVLYGHEESAGTDSSSYSRSICQRTTPRVQKNGQYRKL